MPIAAEILSVLALLAPGATPVDVTHRRDVQQMTTIAVRYWRRPACPVRVLEVWQMRWSTGTTGWDQGGFEPAAAVALPGHCTIVLSRAAFRGTLGRQERCRTIAHEVGHLHGYAHRRYRSDPHGVMLDEGTPLRCERYTP